MALILLLIKYSLIMESKVQYWGRFCFVSLLCILLFVACNNAQPSPTPANENEPADASPSAPAYPGPSDSGYPAPSGTDSSDGYPGAGAEIVEGVQAVPPDPERNPPTPQPDTGVVSGVLIREVTDQGFIPLTPRGLYLARILQNDSGEQALMRRGDDAPQAQLLPTGIFIFNDVPPEIYGIIIDVGFAQFPLEDEEGAQIVITVEPGQSIDLGQVFVELPE